MKSHVFEQHVLLDVKEDMYLASLRFHLRLRFVCWFPYLPFISGSATFSWNPASFRRHCETPSVDYFLNLNHCTFLDLLSSFRSSLLEAIDTCANLPILGKILLAKLHCHRSERVCHAFYRYNVDLFCRQMSRVCVLNSSTLYYLLPIMVSIQVSTH